MSTFQRKTVGFFPYVWLGLGLLGAIPSPGWGQEDAEASENPPVSELIEVSEVALDVLVTDRDGNPKTGLGVDDFVVEEDGQPVKITGVSYYSNRYGEGETTAPTSGEIPTSRYLIFFFHDQSSFQSDGAALIRQQIKAARDAMRWISTEMGASDWAAVARYDVRLRVYQDFTQDRDALLAALDAATIGKDPDSFKLDQGRPSERGRVRELKILSRLEKGEALSRETRNPYDGLQKVAEATGFLVGRKILLLYSTGFGLRRGRTSLPDPRYYPALETVLNDHNVAIYPIDLTPAGRPPMQEDFLNQLAEDSGGAYDPNFSGYLQPLRTVARANTGYYLLTFRSERPAGQIGYQRVTVKAKDPDLRLLTRKGYRYGI